MNKYSNVNITWYNNLTAVFLFDGNNQIYSTNSNVNNKRYKLYKCLKYRKRNAKKNVFQTPLVYCKKIINNS